MSDDSQPPVDAAAPGKIEPWPPERLREGLLSDAAGTRLEAVAMAVLADADITGCAEALASCVDQSRDDPIVLQIAAVALGNVKQKNEQDTAANSLATLTASPNAAPVRTFAAHGLAQLERVPEGAWPGLSDMLFSDDSVMRQVALRCVTPVAPAGAAHIAHATAQAKPERWRSEGLLALARSAGTSDGSRQSVEDYLVKSLKGQALFPSGVAGYAALAQLNPSGSGPLALSKIAGAEDDQAALAAILAIAQIGESAREAIPGLVDALVKTEVPEREEAICRAFLALRIKSGEVPLRRVLERIELGPDRSVAAVCLLLCLHAKPFAAASKAVAARFTKSGEALQRVLDQVHHTLVGVRLLQPDAPPAKS